MQHLTEKELQELSDKWLSGDLSCEERVKLDKWYNQELPGAINWENGDNNEFELGERLFEGIQKAQKEPPVRHRPFIIKIGLSHTRKLAAALVLLTGAALFYYLLPFNKSNTGVGQAILSGTKNTNKAILTLADGSTVILDKTRKGLVAKQRNTQVNKTGNGSLSYHSTVTGMATSDMQYNSIATPVGSQYEVTLADGTKVWLNALSSLKYPTAFNGADRVVELTGEAYFEVAKNKHKPFKVILADHASIEVLGTHFNIMAYQDETNINATLLEGSIKVKKGAVDQMIIPGEQAEITDQIKVSAVDAQKSIAWKNGLFSFDRSDTKTIMRQIGRWYGVEIAYQGKIPANQLTGYIARSSNLTEVLKMLEISGVKSSIKENKVTIIN
ncbi:MAG: FecR family protein [Mucilaginibacter sp.]|uniref:FecR family protein n=1 Tax=Mucilaginibacter sp. TaxID=1882438 RepID=UPI003263D512